MSSDPAELVSSLYDQLVSRQIELQRLTDYYEGRHRLAFSSEKFRTAFGGMFAAYAENFMPLVVQAVEQRLNVQGFRYGDDPANDKDAWGIWQANNLDGLSQLAHKESLSRGDSYVIVWGNSDGSVRVTVESADQCIVAYSAGDRTQRIAALKSWADGNGTHAILFLADGVYKYVQDVKSLPLGGQTISWRPEQGSDDSWPLPNPIGEVPVVAITNDPRLTSPYGISEFLTVIPTQDAINKTLADMLVASEYIAFPMRTVAGAELQEDDQGNLRLPYNIAVDKLLVSENPLTRFGTLEAGSLDNYINAVKLHVQNLATRTSTPPHYFNIGGNLPSGDAIKAAETGLVAKARRKMLFYGEAWEEVMRLCFAVQGDPRASVTNGETIWANPEYRSESELADALVKRAAIDVPREQLWEDAGYSPTQIARFRAMRLMDQLEAPFTPGIPKLPQAPVTAEA